MDNKEERERDLETQLDKTKSKLHDAKICIMLIVYFLGLYPFYYIYKYFVRIDQIFLSIVILFVLIAYSFGGPFIIMKWLDKNFGV